MMVLTLRCILFTRKGSGFQWGRGCVPWRFCSRTDLGYGYEQCCHFASAVSALKCTGMGARESVPTRSKVMEFLRRNGYAI